MHSYKNTIEDVMKIPKKAISKVSFHRYLTNSDEPAETISEMRLPGTIDQNQDRINSAGQKRGVHKLALKLSQLSK